MAVSFSSANNSSSDNIGYYRSRIITTNASINKLISAAAPIFLLAEKLHYNHFTANRNKLLQDLTHEIKAFENKAYLANYRPVMITNARFALCALLDSIISQTSWGRENTWDYNTLTQTCAKTNSNTNFFSLLESSLKDPKDNLELLELYYLILSFGFEGEYQTQENKHKTLTTISDNLYTVIRQQRDTSNKDLLITTTTNQQTHKKTSWKNLLLITIGIILLLNFSTYLVYRIKLGSMMSPLTTMIQQHNDAIRNLGEPK